MSTVQTQLHLPRKSFSISKQAPADFDLTSRSLLARLVSFLTLCMAVLLANPAQAQAVWSNMQSFGGGMLTPPATTISGGISGAVKVGHGGDTVTAVYLYEVGNSNVLATQLYSTAGMSEFPPDDLRGFRLTTQLPAGVHQLYVTSYPMNGEPADSQIFTVTVTQPAASSGMTTAALNAIFSLLLDDAPTAPTTPPGGGTGGTGGTGGASGGEVTSGTASVISLDPANPVPIAVKLPHLDNPNAGTLSGSLSVSASGQATYSLPIAVPPGTAGLAPQLSLNYSSEASNGPLGLGWSFGGLSTIHRCGKTIAQDQMNGRVSFEKSDRLCLDGQRLVLVNLPASDENYWATNAEYRTELESFSRIRTVMAGGRRSFEVQTKDGRIMNYGSASGYAVPVIGPVNSGAFAQPIGSKPEARLWALDQVKDRIGNYINYGYEQDLSSGEHRLATIRYGGNGLNPHAAVRVNYVGRNDAWKRFLDETRNDLRSRVSSIETYVGDNLSGDLVAAPVARKYTLAYDYSPTSGRSLLASVQVCATNPQTSVCEPLNPTRFDWGKPDTSVQPGFTKIGNWANGPVLTTNNPYAENSTILLSASNHAEYFSFADFGGDGLLDVLEKRVSGPMPSDYGTVPQFQRDLNNPVAPGTSRTQYNYFHNTGNAASGFVRYTYNILAEGRNLPFVVLDVADFNGDGAPDLLVSTRDGSVDKPRICISPLAHGAGLPSPGGMITFTCNNQPAVGSNRDVDLPYTVDIKGDGRSGHYGPYNPATGKARLCVGDACIDDANPPSMVLSKVLWDEQLPMHPLRDYVSFSQMIDFAGIGRPTEVRWSQPYFWHFVDTDGSVSNIYEWLNPVPQIVMTDFRMPGSADPLGAVRSFAYPVTREPCTDSLSCRPYYFDAPEGGSVAANFNGDGYSNVVFGFYGVDSSGYRFKKPEFTLCLSTGRALDCSVRAKYSGDNYVSPVTVGDFVGDGMPGILANKVTFSANNGTPIKTGNLQMCRLQGDDNGGVSDINMVCEPWGGFTYPNVGSSALHDQVFFLDLMGTGRPQLVQYKAGKFVNGVWQENGAWEVYAAVDRAKPNEALDRLVRVTNGLGAVSSVEYADGVANNVVRLGDKKLDYPNFVSRSTGKVVARIRQSNGVSADRTTAYTYFDAGQNLHGRGALGFAAMASIDEQTGIKTTTKYLQEWPYNGMIDSQTVTSGAGVVLSESKNVPAKRNISQAFGATTFVYTSSNKTERRDLDGSPLGITDTVNTYGDNFGNLTNQSVTSYPSVGAEKYSTVTDTQYRNDAAGWLLGLPELIKVTRTDPKNGSLTRTVSKGYLPSTGLLDWETVEPGTPKLSVTKTFSRDSNPFGLVNVVTETWLNPDPSDPTNKTRSTTTTYDVKGRFVATITNAKQHKEEHMYDPATGVRVRLIGPNNLRTVWEVDGFGNVNRELRADGNETRRYRKSCDAACPAGAVAAQIVDQVRGSVRVAAPTVIYVDAAGHVLRTMTWGFDGRTIVNNKRYDQLGRLWEEDQPRFSGATAYLAARHSYDELGREVKLTTPKSGGGELNATTDYMGMTRRMTNAAGKQRRDNFNVIGQLVSAIDSLNNETRYEYDPFGGLHKTIDPAKNEIIVDYDLLGRRTGLHDPDLGWISYDVDPLGRTWGTTTPKSRPSGRQSRVVFDELDRMVSRYETDLESHWIFDTAANGIGQLAEAYTRTQAGEDYRRTHTYDGSGRPTQIKQKIGSGSLVSDTSFDAWGRLSKQTYSSTYGQTKAFDYRYNQFGGLARIDRGGLALIETIEVDAAGRSRQAKLGNGLLVKKQYNALTGSLDDGQLITGSGDLRLHEGYQYDELHNVTKRSQYWDKDGFQEDFTYDDLNRLETSTVMGKAKQTFVYNAIGNIINKPNVSSGNFEYLPSGPNSVRPHAVKAIPNLGDFGYDDNGNMVSGTGRSAEWMSFDMPWLLRKGGESSTFNYGPEHQRTRQEQKPSGRVTLYTVGQEVTLINGIPTTVKTFWPAGLGFEVETIGASTVLNWGHSDRLGSLVAISDSNGNLVEKLAYDAWGKRRTLDGSATPDDLDGLKDNRGYTGHEMLDKLDLVHMNGRVYDPLLGRFLSADPLLQDPMNSQSYNRYSYVLNNPTNMVDPTGFASNPAEDLETNKRRQIIRAACANSAAGLACRSDVGRKMDDLQANNPGTELAYSDGMILAKIPAAKNGGVSANSSNENAPPPPNGTESISVRNEGRPDVEYKYTYNRTLLSRTVGVDIESNSLERVVALSVRLDSAIKLINDHARELSREERRIIQEITGFYVRDDIRTGMDMAAGVFRLRSSYIENSSAIWLSSVIAHDSFHIEQRRQGYFYNRISAPAMESEANRFQIRVGKKLGLTPREIDYLKNDTHTLYNTGAY